MARKKRERIEKHKQSLGEVMEDPETYGVRVRCFMLPLSVCMTLAPSRRG